jgi:hypothetical protein
MVTVWQISSSISYLGLSTEDLRFLGAAFFHGELLVSSHCAVSGCGQRLTGLDMVDAGESLIVLLVISPSCARCGGAILSCESF